MEFPPIKHGGDPLSAPDVNKLTRGLREINSLIPRGVTASAAGQDGVLRDVKYTETTNANAYGVVMLCDELLTDVAEVRRNSITEAIAPDLGNGSIDFGIAGVGGVIAGGVANVLVSGISPVVVNIQNTSHEYADIQHASEFLISGWQGRAKILWKETTATGEQWAIVKFIAEEWEWRKIYSASGAVPASSFAEITGYDDGKKAFTVKQPSEDSLDATQVCISEATPMTASGQYSIAHVGYAPASVIHTGDTPSVGDDFGTKESSWDGEKDKTGFKACGVSGGRASVSPFRSCDTFSEIDLHETLNALPPRYIEVEHPDGATVTNYTEWYRLKGASGNDVDISVPNAYGYVYINSRYELQLEWRWTADGHGSGTSSIWGKARVKALGLTARIIGVATHCRLKMFISGSGTDATYVSMQFGDTSNILLDNSYGIIEIYGAPAGIQSGDSFRLQLQ